MTAGKLQQQIKRYRDLLAQHEAEAERKLILAHAKTLERINPALDKLYQQIAAKRAAGQEIPRSWLYEERRLETIKRLISREIDHYAALTHMSVGSILHEAADLGTRAALAQLETTVPANINWSFGVPSQKAIVDITGATKEDTPLARLFTGFGQEAADKAGDALIAGITLGENPRTIARLLAQALDISRARAQTIARTEMLRAYRSANLETFRANADVVEQWRWTCALNARTCIACLMMDGTLHNLDEDMESHPNCRCTPTPVTKSWADILGPLGIDSSGIDEVDFDRQSGADWFGDQDKSVQQQILGKAKYDAWQKGDFRLKDLVGRAHDPNWGSSIYEKSLKQVRKGG